MSGNLSHLSGQIEHAVESDVPAGEFSPVPPADYHLEGIAADLKKSATGNQYVDVQFRIIGGRYDNRRIFEKFMLEGNERSVAISMRQLNDLAVFNGRNRLSDTSDIVGVHCVAAVYVEPGQDGYKDKNRAKKFRKYTGEVTAEKTIAEGSGGTVNASEEEVKGWF